MLADLCEELERRTLVVVLQGHPEWRLADLLEVMQGEGPRARTLQELTIGELCSPCSEPSVGELRARRREIEQLSGPDFDDAVAEIIAEAAPRWVAAGYVRERAGGPRWKLQKSFTRLVEAGAIERRGVSSARRYRVRRG